MPDAPTTRSMGGVDIFLGSIPSIVHIPGVAMGGPVKNKKSLTVQIAVPPPVRFEAVLMLLSGELDGLPLFSKNSMLVVPKTSSMFFLLTRLFTPSVWILTG